jgi:hypothetical protein
MSPSLRSPGGSISGNFGEVLTISALEAKVFLNLYEFAIYAKHSIATFKPALKRALRCL